MTATPDGVVASKVDAVLRRNGRSRMRPRMPREEVIRYERLDARRNSKDA